MSVVGRVIREPLVHFLLIGIALFAVYGRVRSDAGAGSRIVITQAVVDDLRQQHQARWSRPPSAEELRAAVNAYVEDEILYREGVALGLDQDDAVIKRRVRQKLEVMAEEAAAGAEPGDAELSAYLASHAPRFTQPAVVSFGQVFLGAELSPAATAEAADAARAALARGLPASRVGSRTLLPREMSATPVDMVGREFGEQFGAQLAELPVGEWAGPVSSGFGAHLVRMSARTPAAVPPLAAVRAAVLREWEHDRRERALAEHYGALRRSYDVVLEAQVPPPGAP